MSHRALEAARVPNLSYLYYIQDSKSGDYDYRDFENCCTRLAEVRDLAEALEFDTISNYAERLMLEFHQAQGVASYVEDLDRLEKRHKSTGDTLGAGVC